MKKLSFVLRASTLAVASALVLSGCGKKPEGEVKKATVSGAVTTVNGKSVPKARVEALIEQATRSGQQPRSPELEAQVRDEVVLREMFMQEAQKRRLTSTKEFKEQMELARQSILIRALFKDYEAKNPVTDAEITAEYEKAKNESMGNQFRASHILVDKEEDAKALIAQIKAGAKFEALAKASSKDKGSAQRGGDLDWARAADFVPDFSKAMTQLNKGEMTQEPVKSPFGYHIIRLDDQKTVDMPPLEAVKDQLRQELTTRRMGKFRDEIKAKAKTDYKFANN